MYRSRITLTGRRRLARQQARTPHGMMLLELMVYIGILGVALAAAFSVLRDSLFVVRRTASHYASVRRVRSLVLMLQRDIANASNVLPVLRHHRTDPQTLILRVQRPDREGSIEELHVVYEHVDHCLSRTELSPDGKALERCVTRLDNVRIRFVQAAPDVVGTEVETLGHGRRRRSARGRLIRFSTALRNWSGAG